MALNKRIEEITEPDLQALKDQAVAEDQSIDYKKGLFLKPDPAKDEFRADVTSFANGTGGHLVIGMDEDKGFPTDLCGMEIPDQDTFTRQIDEVLQNKVTPPVPGYRIRYVSLSNGKTAVVVRVPQSYAKPHQITVGKDDFQFWVRNSAGKKRLVVEELRSIILQSEALEARIRAFRQERLANIIAGDGALPTEEGPKVVYHLIPISAFSSRQNFDLTAIRSGSRASGVMDFGSSLSYNLEGIVFHNLPGHRGEDAKTEKYAQVFRNGIIEAVDGYGLSGGRKQIDGYRYDARIVGHISGLLRDSQRMGVEAPIILMVTLIGAQGYTIYSDAYMSHQYNFFPIKKEVLQLPDVQVNDYVTPVVEIVQPILDALWNSAGWERSMSYDPTGVWLNKAR